VTSSTTGRGLVPVSKQGDKMAATMSNVDEMRNRVILEEFGVKNVRNNNNNNHKRVVNNDLKSVR